jgi:hypothetical protein
MTSINAGSARRLLAIVLVLTLPACLRDLATEPLAPDAVLHIEAVSPTQVKGTVGERIDPVPIVVVRNEEGRPVAGAKVIFIPLNRSDAANADFLTTPNVITNSRGLATPGAWKLGTVPGVHGLEARLVDPRYFRSDSGRVVTFKAEVTAAAAEALSMGRFPLDTEGLPGGEMPTPLFQVVDRYGNGVGGVTVTFTVIAGGGSLAKTRVQSSPWGQASAGEWTLGPQPGTNSMVASAQNLKSVTFSTRALDVGKVTWYDLAPQSVRYIERASMALCEDGTFELLTLESSEAFPDLWPERELGKYTVTGTGIVLTFASGVTEQGTLIGQDLSFMQQNLNREDYPVDNWRFFKRGEPAPRRLSER